MWFITRRPGPLRRWRRPWTTAWIIPNDIRHPTGNVHLDKRCPNRGTFTQRPFTIRTFGYRTHRILQTRRLARKAARPCLHCAAVVFATDICANRARRFASAPVIIGAGVHRGDVRGDAVAAAVEVFAVIQGWDVTRTRAGTVTWTDLGYRQARLLHRVFAVLEVPGAAHEQWATNSDTVAAFLAVDTDALVDGRVAWNVICDRWDAAVTATT